MSYSNFVQNAQEEIRALIPAAFCKAMEAGQLPQGASLLLHQNGDGIVTPSS